MDKWNWVKPDSGSVKLDSPIKESYGNAAFIFFLTFQWSRLIYFILDYDYVLQVNYTNWVDNTFSLTSPQFTVSGNEACFTFYYYFLADATKNNDLTVTLIDQIHNNNTMIWSSAGINIDRWERAQVQIDQAGTYKVR